MHSKRGFIKGFLLFVIIYLLLALLLFWIVKDDWSRTAVVTDTVNKDALLPELTTEDVITQEITIKEDRPQMITVYANLQPGASAEGNLEIGFEESGAEFYSAQIGFKGISSDGIIIIPVKDVPFPEQGSVVTLTLKSTGGISLWYGNSKAAGKFDINVETSGLRINGEPVEGELVLVQRGIRYLPYMNWYWLSVTVLLVLISITIIYCYFCRVKGRKNIVNTGVDLVKQYKYLLKTLVVRDFKIKYKASVLGVLWSFLNPLLMTFVYLFVFSTLFRSSIENFVVYLMSGIILFNYFSESTNMGMQSIVGNAGLITKVYMPKYILPISKALSGGINLIISLIPLLIVMLLTGVRFSKSLLLIPLVLFFLILFSIGVSLILASAMVYFRDVQFLWGIFVTILNFLCPIFYPESIIPARFITLYHMNPMYQFMFFLRTITIGGISPTPVTYLYCIIGSLGALGIGLLVFRKCQSQFVLHL